MLSTPDLSGGLDRSGFSAYAENPDALSVLSADMLSQGRVGASALSGAAMEDNGFFVVPENNWNASDAGFSLVGDVPFAALKAAAAAPVLNALLPEQIKPGKVTWQGRQIEILADGDKRNPGKAPTDEKGVWIIDPDGPLKTFSSEIAATAPSFLRIQDLTEQNYVSPDKRVTKVIADDLPPSLLLPAWMTDSSVGPATGTTIDTSNIGKRTAKVSASPAEIAEVEARYAKIFNEIQPQIQKLKDAGVPLPEPASFSNQEAIVGIADFNGDQSRDILVQNKGTQELTIWYMSGASKIGEAPVVGAVAGLGYEVAGVGDFNSDGKADIIWRNPNAAGSGYATVCWYLNGNQLIGGGAFPVFGSIGAGWDLRVEDFNNDGKADLLWQNLSTNQTLIWYMNGLTAINPSVPGGSYAFLPSLPSPAANWRMIGAGRIDGDAIPDIFMHNLATGAVQGWLITPSNIQNQVNATLSSVIQQNSNNPQIVPASSFLGTAVGDLDGNGKADIAWKSQSGYYQSVLWFMATANGLKLDYGGIAPFNSQSSSRGTFDSSGYHSGFGYGMIDASAAIRYLNGQFIPEIVDPAPGWSVGGVSSVRQNEMVNAPEAWQVNFTGQGRLIAILDSGVNINHEDINDNIAPGGWNAVLNNADVTDLAYYSSSNALSGHGTGVAGVASAELTINGNANVTGVAHRARILPVRITDNAGVMRPEFLDDAIRYAADQGADAINISYSITDENYYNNNPDPVLRQVLPNIIAAVDYAVSRGSVVVIAAGNEPTVTIGDRFLPRLSERPGVIAVGGVHTGINSQPLLASNNAGYFYNLSTRAGNVIRHYVDAPGDNITTLWFGNNTQYIEQGGGTSYAAPMVSAAVALIRQAMPFATPQQIVDALINTSDPGGITV